MKRLFLLSICLVSAFLIASCEQPAILSLSQTALSFDNAGGSQSVNLTANKFWTASSDQGWLRVSPSSGEGSAAISVTCEANKTYESRTGTITITSEELSQTISVTQAEGQGLIVSQTEFNLTNDAQSFLVEVQANVQYTVAVDASCSDWIRQESTKGLSSNTIKFSVSKNESYDGREGLVTIRQTNGSLKGTILVKQSQQNGLFVSTPEYVLSNESHTLTVEVKSNVEFEVKSNADWIKHVSTKGLNTSQIVLEVAENKEYDGRKGTVSVKQKNGTLEGIITINQEQGQALFVTQSEYTLSNAQQKIEVELKYNVDYDVVIPDSCKDWISLVSTKGLSTRHYTFSIAKNETYDEREGSVTFKQKNGALSGTVRISQSQTDGIIAEKTEYVLSDEAQQFEIKVNSNIDFEVVIDEACRDWLTHVQTKAMKESAITLQVTKNEGSDRSGKIYFKGAGIQETVTIRQGTGVVIFKDANFKAYCVDNFDKDGDGEISLAEAVDVTTITVSTKNIASLQGIEFFPNLNTLSCFGEWNQGQPVGKLTELDVSKNTLLRYLYCGYNQLKSLDVSNNTTLNELVCFSNQLKSLDVSKNTALQELDCNGNKITSLDVRKNTALRSLYCSNNPIQNLDVSRNVALVYLSCVNNQLKSLDVSRNTAMRSLYCYRNQLTELSVSNNTALTSLDCCENQLTSLDVSRNIELTYLSCGNNKLTSLDIGQNTELTEFDCNSNLLTSMDVSNNKQLRFFGCINNKLKDINVSSNTALENLACYNNQLTTLDVSHNIQLKQLACDNNKLKSIDISFNTALERLSCSENQLTTLNCHNNTVLNYLHCSNNQLASIDVSNSPELLSFYCWSNLLTTLDVSNNLKLDNLWCYNNPYLTEIWLKAGQTIRSFEYDWNVSTIIYK